MLATTDQDLVMVREDPLASRASGISGRLERMGFRVALVADEAQLRELLKNGTSPSAVVLNVGLGSSSVRDSLAVTHQAARHHDVTVLAVGDEPHGALRDQLRHAGVSLAAFGPVDDHTLRFQVNRAFLAARGEGPARRELRAPVDWETGLLAGRRLLSGTVYNISAGGAFIETVRPPALGTVLQLDLPLPFGTSRVSGEVVHVNLPGHQRERRAPVGLGVRFDPIPLGVRSGIETVLTDRCSDLLL